MKKKVTLAVSMIVILSMLSGCNSLQQKPTVKNIKIGVTLYDQYDTFLSQLMNDFNEYAAQEETNTGLAVNVEEHNAATSQSTQNSQVENMINDGCNVICVNLVDRTEPTTIIDMAEKNNIPVIFFNRELVEEDLQRWDRLYYVGASAKESGVMQGELAADYISKHPEADKNKDGMIQYVVLEGEAGHQDAIVRTESSVSTLMSKGVVMEKLGYAIANWNRAQAQTKMSQLITQFGSKIELVLPNNDDMALGAIDALQDAKIPREKWPVIVGIDGTDVGLQAVQSGEMAGTVYNDKEGQAKAMLELSFDLATGKDYSNLKLENGKYIRLPYTKITSKEVSKYLNRMKSNSLDE